MFSWPNGWCLVFLWTDGYLSYWIPRFCSQSAFCSLIFLSLTFELLVSFVFCFFVWLTLPVLFLYWTVLKPRCFSLYYTQTSLVIAVLCTYLVASHFTVFKTGYFSQYSTQDSLSLTLLCISVVVSHFNVYKSRCFSLYCTPFLLFLAYNCTQTSLFLTSLYTNLFVSHFAYIKTSLFLTLLYK